MDYARPTDLEEALRFLSQQRWKILAGGTDFYPALGGGPLKDAVLDINGLATLKGISETDDHIIIGARTSWTDILNAPLFAAFDGLKLAAREVGSIQIQNTGTVAGNLCNASPAADGVPPLLTLDAEVELRSVGAARHVPLSTFIEGNRKTTLRPDELLTCIRVPKRSTAGTAGFVKLGARRYLVISIAMAAVRVVLDGGRIGQAALAVGSCSAVAQRLTGLEEQMAGADAGALPELAAAYEFPELNPIDDVRGTAAYRRAAAREIVMRALSQALAREERGGLAA